MTTDQLLDQLDNALERGRLTAALAYARELCRPAHRAALRPTWTQGDLNRHYRGEVHLPMHVPAWDRDSHELAPLIAALDAINEAVER